MKVDVIIPCARKTHLKAVKKALKDQTYPCTVIVIYDTSRNGASWSRNQGIKKSQGDIILFLDDDNIPPKNWVETYVQQFKKTKADILGGNYIETHPFLSFLKNYFSTSANAKKVGIGGNIGFRSSFIQKVIQRDGTFFNEYLKYGSEDWELMARVQSFTPKVLFIDNPNYHQKTLTGIQYLSLQYQRAKTVRQLKTFIEKFSVPGQESIAWNSSSSNHILRKYIAPLNPFLFPKFSYFIQYWLGVLAFTVGYLIGKSAPRISVIIPKGYQFLNETKKSSFGGAEVQLSLLGEAMSKLYDVSMITADYGQEKKTTQRGMNILRSFSFSDTSLVKVIKLYSSMYRSSSNYFIQRALSELSFFSAFYCFIMRKKFIYMVAHDGETDGTHHLYKSFFGRLLIHFTFSLSHKIIVQNTYEQKKLRKYKPIILKKGVPDIPLSSKKKFDVIWVGRADDWKEPYRYLELAESLPGYTFAMVIRCATNKEDQCKKLLRDAKKIPNIQIYQNMSFTQTNTLTSQAKLFCLTSTQEGDWPMTVLQSLSAGVPIVSLHLNHGSLVKEGAGYYAKHDMKLLKKYTKQILSNTKKRSQLSLQAKMYATTYHDFPTQTKKLLRYIL